MFPWINLGINLGINLEINLKGCLIAGMAAGELQKPLRLVAVINSGQPIKLKNADCITNMKIMKKYLLIVCLLMVCLNLTILYQKALAQSTANVSWQGWGSFKNWWWHQLPSDIREKLSDWSIGRYRPHA